MPKTNSQAVISIRIDIPMLEGHLLPSTGYSLPELSDGEYHAGLILGKDDEPSYFLIGLPGEFKGTWKKSTDWAASIGGELPNRRELNLLRANAREQFKDDDWYWSSETHASYSDYAWVQDFGLGYQFSNLKGLTYRARAVRRLPL